MDRLRCFGPRVCSCGMRREVVGLPAWQDGALREMATFGAEDAQFDRIGVSISLLR